MLLLLWPRENSFLLPCPMFVRRARLDLNMPGICNVNPEIEALFISPS